jgi:tetraacyldisaccharide 4'-kinase
MKKALLFWGEKYLFSPGIVERLLSLLLYPLSLLYCFIVWVKYKRAKPLSYGLPIISVGNLIVGGSGKTPLSVALARRYSRPAIVLRGYGRGSKGMHLVSDGSRMMCDVSVAGDEAMLYAALVPQAIVIVCEQRSQGIEKAKSLGAELLFLDDGYSKHEIKKLDLLIVSRQKNSFCLPAGPFRERLWQGKEAVQIEEGRDFTRRVKISNPKEKMVLVTGISKPQRLDSYLDARVVEKFYFPDHHPFEEEELNDILSKTQAQSLLVTRKDAVKMEAFSLALSYLELELEVDEKIHQSVQEYVRISSQNPRN